MEISFEKLKNSSAEELYELLFLEISKIKDDYKYAEIEEFIYKKVFEKVIKDIKNNLKKFKADEIGVFFNKSFRNNLDNYIKEQLKNLDKNFNIVVNYVSLNISVQKSNEDAMGELRKLFFFLKKFGCVFDNKLCGMLLEIPVINSLLEIITLVNLDLISSNSLDKITKNNFIVSLIKSYCVLNGIQVGDSDDFESVFDDEELDFVLDSTKVYLNEINSKLLTAEEEKEIMMAVKDGDSQARKVMIESNLKLVVSIAKKYVGRGLSFQDLIQEGNIGLIKAVDKFDISRGTRFSTYATFLITQSIIRAVYNKGRNIRLPVYVYGRLSNIRKIENTLKIELDREPTIEEVAEYLDIPVEEIERLKEACVDTLSLNACISNEENSELEDFVPSSEKNPEEVAMDNGLQASVRKLLVDCNLSEKEVKVLTLRYGFDNNEPKTLKEVSTIMGLTRERIRQIENRTLKKLSRSSHIKDLAVFMDNPDKALDNVHFMVMDSYNTGKKYSWKTAASKNEEKCNSENCQDNSSINKNLILEQLAAVKMEVDSWHVGDYDFSSTVKLLSCISSVDKIIYDVLMESVNDLSDGNRELILLYFGFINLKCYTSKELASKFSMSNYYVMGLVNDFLQNVNCQLKTRINDTEVVMTKVELFKFLKKIYKSVRDYLDGQNRRSNEEKNDVVVKKSSKTNSKLDDVKVSSSQLLDIKTKVQSMYLKSYNERLMIENLDCISNYDKSIYRVIKEVIDSLQDGDKEIVLLYLGFVDINKYSVADIGKEFEISELYIEKLVSGVYRKIEEKFQEVLMLKDAVINQNVIFKFISKLDKKVLKYLDEQKELNEGKKEDVLQEEKTDVSHVEQKEVKVMAKKLNNIYEYFSDYSKEQVDEMIAKLSDEDRELLRKKYGDDLENPNVNQKLTKEERTVFYGCLLSAMKRLLKNPDGKRRGSKVSHKIVNDNSMIAETQVVESSVVDISNDEKELLGRSNIVDSSCKENLQEDIGMAKQNDVLEKNDCLSLLQLMRTPSFSEMLNVLSPKEAVVVCLRLGYVDEKCFTTESIAGFLGLSDDEVREITKKVLLLYKDKINSFIDSAIDNSLGQSLNLK